MAHLEEITFNILTSEMYSRGMLWWNDMVFDVSPVIRTTGTMQGNVPQLPCKGTSRPTEEGVITVSMIANECKTDPTKFPWGGIYVRTTSVIARADFGLTPVFVSIPTEWR